MRLSGFNVISHSKGCCPSIVNECTMGEKTKSTSGIIWEGTYLFVRSFYKELTFLRQKYKEIVLQMTKSRMLTREV